MSTTATLPEEELKLLKKIHLHYVSDSKPGIKRIRLADTFTYVMPNGSKVTDPESLGRIKSLVIPPAWENVWICKDAHGHLQATGVDQKQRKQYRYHSDWNSHRNERKYSRLLAFGKKLPLIRSRIQTDLEKKGLPREKVVAIVLAVMQKTLIRVGNAVYADLYQSYGLTTMQTQHVEIHGQDVNFHFIGKKGVEHHISLHNSRLSRLLKKVSELPGQELFQYQDEHGNRHPIDSGMVNEYLHEVCGEEFSAKDIRTWSGTAYMLHLLAEAEPFDTQAACKRNIVTLLDEVARYLGNTRTVCKKYYVHPAILNAYEKKELDNYFAKIRKSEDDPSADIGLSTSEKVLMTFLKDLAATEGILA